MEKVNPPAVPGTVHCAVCMTGYVLTPDQAAVLAGLGPVSGWQRVAEKYAVAAGWHLRTDGLLLCPTDGGPSPRPVTPAH